MSDKLEFEMKEDRALRDAAMALVKADIEHIRSDVSGRGLGTRIADRVSEVSTDVFDEAVEIAEDNKGVLAALAGALVLWFARNPILELFGFHTGDDAEQDAR